MALDFLFDEYFITHSLITVDFVCPSDHSDLLADICQLSRKFSEFIMVQRDNIRSFSLTFVTCSPFYDFHTKLYCLVQNLRCKYHLSFNSFHYL